LTEGRSSNSPGVKANPTVMAAHPATPVNATERQRALGGAPVGNNRGKRTNDPKIAGVQIQLASHAAHCAASA
jgi:hypothetical protein